jgi:flagellar basal-body rod protein FlgB
MLENLDLFRMSAAMARHAGQKQALTAQNIANVNSPGYVARDLPEFRQSYLPAGDAAMPRATRVRHLHGALPGSPLPAAQEQRAAQSIDGNQVSLEVEMLRAVDAKRQHDRALAIYRSGLSVLRTTIQT